MAPASNCSALKHVAPHKTVGSLILSRLLYSTGQGYGHFTGSGFISGPGSPLQWIPRGSGTLEPLE